MLFPLSTLLFISYCLSDLGTPHRYPPWCQTHSSAACARCTAPSPDECTASTRPQIYATSTPQRRTVVIFYNGPGSSLVKAVPCRLRIWTPSSARYVIGAQTSLPQAASRSVRFSRFCTSHPFPNKKHLKNVGPIRHCEPPLHCHSPGVVSRTPAIAIAQAACDVQDNDNDDDNDNA